LGGRDIIHSRHESAPVQRAEPFDEFRRHLPHVVFQEELTIREQESEEREARGHESGQACGLVLALRIFRQQTRGSEPVQVARRLRVGNLQAARNLGVA